MRIVTLTAENVKRIRAVEISPDGNVVVIAGRNAQGKTSVLDSIWLALGGGAASRGTAKPIRDGEERAQVTLDLGDLRVTRTWTAAGTTLKVENADGASYKSPQAMLDGLVGRLSFDPLAFAQQDGKTQLATLLDLVDLPFDPAQMDAKRRAAFDERTAINRDVKQLEGQLAGMPEAPAGLPAEEVSAADLLAKARSAQQYQDRAVHLRSQHATAVQRVEQAARELEAAKEAEESAAALVREIPENLPDPAQYETQLAELEQTNAAVRAAKARTEVLRLLDNARGFSQSLTDQLAAIDATRAQAMAEAKMPIDGLGFDEDGVTYQGMPFKQASAAEQLRVSVAMAMALNPKVRVIRITDGSLLDSTNLALIEQMAADRDFQVWIERVDETGTVGILIEDGQVATTTELVPA
jgi:hypothetical protein